MKVIRQNSRILITRLGWDQCYVLGNILAGKIGEKIVDFEQH
jgi:hypothetical protein